MNTCILKYKMLLLAYLFVFTFNQGTLQGQELYFRVTHSDVEPREFAADNGLKVFYVITQSSFAPNDNLNEKKLVASLRKTVPNENDAGLLVLDWEGEGMKALKNPANKKHQYYQKQFIKAIKIVKKERPKLKVAYYGLPFREFWKMDSKWKERNKSLKSIYKEVDFLTPAVYVLYDNAENNGKLNENYIQQNLLLASEIGSKYEIPVYPMVYHKYHPSNKNYNGLVSLKTFDVFIKKISEFNYNNKPIDAILWWQSETYSANINKIEDKTFMFELFQTYLDIFKANTKLH